MDTLPTWNGQKVTFKRVSSLCLYRTKGLHVPAGSLGTREWEHTDWGVGEKTSAHLLLLWIGMSRTSHPTNSRGRPWIGVGLLTETQSEPSYKLMCLNAWSLLGGTAFGGCGIFLERGLMGRCRPLRVGFEGYSPAEDHFLCAFVISYTSLPSPMRGLLLSLLSWGICCCCCCYFKL